MLLINLQLFGDEGAPADSGEISEAAAQEEGRNSLENVIYGKPEEELQDDAAKEEPVKKTFEELIKGEYKKDFDTRVQTIINKRFAETKELQGKLEKSQPIFDMLADKYGVDATDIEALSKAIADDDSYYEEEAVKRGLTVSQLKEMKKTQRELESLRQFEREYRRQEEIRQFNERISHQAATASEYYPDLDLVNEMKNEDFKALIRAGVDVQTAYEVVHKDEIISGAMHQTAQRISEKIANNIQARGNRPAENGVNSTQPATVKTDVNKLTKKDREEIERRVARGERISF